jgi:2-polyprenyl-3-methyl-5-hydroxy-6-metoxy-1,4-benzoquinol methylase
MADEFTGERLPGGGDAEFGIDMERHLAAYRHAASLAAGRSVLDAGCGEGYGAALLAQVASRVVAADRAEATATASARYRRRNLAFHPTDLAHLDALDEQFELVVSFQVIEHVPDPVGFLAALRRRTAPGGTILVTTPNRLMSVSENPYHLREWTAPELAALAAPVLPGCRVVGVHGSERVLTYERERGAQVQRILRLDPWGLRHYLPGFIVREAFPRLARLVRRRVGKGGAMAAVGPEDFTVSGERMEQALDLLIVAGVE